MRPVLLTLMVVASVSKVTLAVTQEDSTTPRAGDMCEKTVSELVPKVVRETISVLRRSRKKCGFLWLKTCSSYSIDFQTVTKKKFVVKSYTKIVCCNGTDVSGNCTTDKTVCSTPGRYGPACGLVCNCDRNHTLPAVCDKVTGYCFCIEGFGGEACSQDLNQTDVPEFDAVVNVTEPLPPNVSTSQVAGGGDIVNRAIIAVIVIVVIFIVVVIVFCCWRRRVRRKPSSDGCSVSDDFVVTLNPTQQTAHYVTPEEVRRRKKEREALRTEEPEEPEEQEKPYDYVEMRSASGARPTLSGASDNQDVTSTTSSLAHKALEQEVDSGRISLAYANMPSSGTMRQESDSSHYYLEDGGPTLVSSPTYSLMRRQESGDSAFDDDGYCTSPTHAGEDINLHYSMPRYMKEKVNLSNLGAWEETATENIYESPDGLAGSVKLEAEKSSSPPEYANVSQTLLPNGLYSHLPTNPSSEPVDDGYDHIPQPVSVV
ncbi:uncharacterized protein LOC135472535 isoform X2 [Liolophura sinensis]|uniref:uncharacterized protein LOC135472535 isoform X2 n=1 Tax=Liolophura sinensis TaxID=3198878 RepID=UPI0031588C68